MAFKGLMTGARLVAGKVGFQIQKKLPEICFVGGGILIGAGVVGACKATLKVSEIIDEAKEQIDDIHSHTDNGESYENSKGEIVPYDQQAANKDLGIVYGRTAVKVVKNYAIPGALIIGGYLLGFKGYRTLNGRYIASTAAAAGYKKLNDIYHNGIIDRFGPEVERDIRLGVHEEEVTRTIQAEDGTEVEEKVMAKVVNETASEFNPFSRFFDESCELGGWTKDPEMNRRRLEAVQNYFNDLLHARGYVFLNEVYKELGMEESRAGQVAGWVLDKAHPNTVIDFDIYGLTKVDNTANRRFINGYETNILIIPNCEPNILIDGYDLDGWCDR